MISAMLQTLVKSVAVLCAFLLMGTFLRAKVPVFRKLLLPSSVIGGTIALLLGPQVWGEYAPLAFSDDFITIWSVLPGVLIVPIFASVPLGDGMNEPEKPKGAIKRVIPNALIACGAMFLCQQGQAAVGLGVNLIGSRLFHADYYSVFGWELNAGFSGGHGTAAAIGAVLQGYDYPKWATAQSVGITFATIGLIGGMVMGIFMINRASARGMTQVLSKPQDIPALISYGFTKNINEQTSMGRETTHNSSVETITVHLGILTIVWALSYWLYDLAVKYSIPGFKDLVVWFYGLLIMYGVNWLLRRLKLDWLIDRRVKSRITGALSDIAIIAAISSMSIKAVLIYIVPILIISLIGFLFTFISCFILYRFCVGHGDYFFERSMILWGQQTGVMINGLMLLKICDPDYESPVLTDFTVGMAIYSIISLVQTPVSYMLLGNAGTTVNFLYSAGIALAFFVMALVGRSMLKRMNPAEG